MLSLKARGRDFILPQLNVPNSVDIAWSTSPLGVLEWRLAGGESRERVEGWRGELWMERKKEIKIKNK